MSNPIYLIIPVAIAYFIGNISPAILIAKSFGIDIRSQGSGNAGSTNVLRVLGKKAAIATLAIDVLKGVIAVLLGRYIGGQSLAVFCGLAVFIGHIWPLLFGFRGGKGIATGFGAIVTIEPILGLEIAVIALLGIVFSKRVAVGSILAAVALPFLAY
ncbi:MAG: glycerol-3-phosphate acyltransferase, partial [Anaerovorax sp.]|nr:glycerol-3-phosphate acyltransferase [Anaerovorax sp.]